MTFSKSIKLSILLVLMLGLASGLIAWSITDSYFGNKVGSMDPRAFAMGGATTYNDMMPFSISSNPANLTLMNRTFGLQGTADITRNEDNRAVPLYNSFDAYIDDAVIASNIHEFYDYAAAGFAAGQLGAFRFGGGVYHQPISSFDGKYREQIRNNRGTDNDGYPEMIAINTIDNEGLLFKSAALASVGFKLGEYSSINLGFDFGILNADVNQETAIRWTQWSIDQVGEDVLPDYTWTNEFKLEGEQMKAGLSMQVNPRFGFAATYVPKATLDATGTLTEKQDAYLGSAGIDTEVDYSDDYIMPSEIRLGLSYQPQNIVRTWFNLDIERVQWTDINDGYDDVYNLYVGVEHRIQNRIPFRIGFQAVNNWRLETEEIAGADPVVWAKKTLTPQITAGSSVALAEGLSLDIGFGFAWREYESLDLFGDSYYNDKLYTGSSNYALWPNSFINLTDRGWENPDKVSENFITLKTGLSFVW